MPNMIETWNTLESVADYARRVDYLSQPITAPSGVVDSGAFTRLPETDTVPVPTASPAWIVRRADILRNRATVETNRRERAYADGFVDGTDAIRADRLARAELRRFAA